MSEDVIRNPILPGFNPDPSIVRVGDDVYIATSTFQWFPGVQIHHSRNLQDWTLVGRPLDRASQLDMRGNPDSCGVWAPCLSHADGLFWLIYTDVKRFEGNYKDAHNYLVTAPSIEGPWSDPVYLNSSGFDPSLFHDDDGRKWLLNLVWDHRRKHNRFAGILLQEYDPEAGRLVGPVTNIFRGTDLKLTEGSHLYKRDGWYYLITAEGGTEYNHAVTMARSRDITGPYEVHPQKHVVTTKDAPDSPLQRAGHGDIVEMPDGETYIVNLVSRPLPGTRLSPRGRETAIERCVWGDDGWLRLETGSQVPRMQVPVTPSGNAGENDREGRGGPPAAYEFDGTLPIDFQWLRTPETDRIFSLEARPGHLRLFGREGIGAMFEQALVARRVADAAYTASTVVDFAPQTYQQCAGLTVYYDRVRFHYLHVTWDDATGQRVLDIMSCEANWPHGYLTYPTAEPVPLPAEGPVDLIVRVDGAALQFAYAVGGGEPTDTGPVLDASLCSDEAAGRGGGGSFTGTFVGMACQDTSGAGLHADFARFDYTPRT